MKYFLSRSFHGQFLSLVSVAFTWLFFCVPLRADTYINSDVSASTLNTGGASNVITDSYAYGNASTDSTVGDNGSDVNLSVGNAGSVTSRDFVVGYGDEVDGTLACRNSVNLTGTGSTDVSTKLTAVGKIAIGLYGSGNSLSLLNGADLNSGNQGFIGCGALNSSTSYSTNTEYGIGYGNRVTVAGLGSTWTLQDSGNAYQTLDVGYYGCSNALEIADGGKVVSGQLSIGYGDAVYGSGITGGHNSVMVGGTAAGDASSLTVNGLLVVGAYGSGNSMAIQNGADVTSTDSGVIGYGAAEGSYLSTNVENGIGYGNSVTVTGSGSTWTLQGNSSYWPLFVGQDGFSNKLTISDGGHVTCGHFCIGAGSAAYSTTGGSNNVTLTGTGSDDTSTKLTVNGNLFVGLYSASNSLKVQSGADVTSPSGYIGGYSSSSSVHGNNATVTGAGSTWIINDDLTIGVSGNTGNKLIIDDDALVQVGGTISIASGNYIYLGDGYLAMAGDYTPAGAQYSDLAALLAGMRVKADNGAYPLATESNTYLVYLASDIAAEYEALLGYSGMTGYTIFSNSLIAVPEPSTFVLLGGFAVMLVRRRTERRRK